MVYCDLNENILEWGSEEIAIPYRSPIDNKVHRYFPDFYVKLKKPKRQTKGYLYETYEYARNQAKWKAASEYCKDRLYVFKVMTEDELGVK